jgi:hypothetical protein
MLPVKVPGQWESVSCHCSPQCACHRGEVRRRTRRSKLRTPFGVLFVTALLPSRGGMSKHCKLPGRTRWTIVSPSVPKRTLRISLAAKPASPTPPGAMTAKEEAPPSLVATTGGRGDNPRTTHRAFSHGQSLDAVGALSLVLNPRRVSTTTLRQWCNSRDRKHAW